MVKNLPASAGGAGDVGPVPGLGRCLEKETATHSSILAWKIPWTEEPCRLQSTGSQRVRRHENTCTDTHTSNQYAIILAYLKSQTV